MKKNCFILLLLSAAGLVCGFYNSKNRELPSDIRNAIIPIEPDSPEKMFRLKNYLADKHIVLLSDGHNDGASKTQICQLIRYLHEQCGYDILMTESDLYDGEFLQRQISIYPDSLVRFSRRYIRHFVSHCSQSAPLFNYAATSLKTNRPLVVSGFDCDFVRDRHAMDSLSTEIRTTLHSAKTKQANGDSLNLFLTGLDSLVHDRNYFSLKNPEKIPFMLRYSDTICHLLQSADEYHALLGRNIRRTVICYTRQERQPAIVAEQREAGLWDNLQWLLEKRYPGRKVIIWASGLHLSDNSKIKDHRENYPATTCGYYLRHSQWKDSIAFFPMFRTSPNAYGKLDKAIHESGCEEGLFLFEALGPKSRKYFSRMEFNSPNSTYRYSELYEGFIIESREEACNWIE